MNSFHENASKEIQERFDSDVGYAKADLKKMLTQAPGANAACGAGLSDKEADILIQALVDKTVDESLKTLQARDGEDRAAHRGSYAKRGGFNERSGGSF